MRESAGTSVKSSLSHTFMYDTRDDRMMATKGVYAKLFQELAGQAPGLGTGVGLGGDASFYKIEAEGQVSRKVGASSLVGLFVHFKKGLTELVDSTVNITSCKIWPVMGSRKGREDDVLGQVPARRSDVREVIQSK